MATSCRLDLWQSRIMKDMKSGLVYTEPESEYCIWLNYRQNTSKINQCDRQLVFTGLSFESCRPNLRQAGVMMHWIVSLTHENHIFINEAGFSATALRMFFLVSPCALQALLNCLNVCPGFLLCWVELLVEVHVESLGLQVVTLRSRAPRLRGRSTAPLQVWAGGLKKKQP